MGLSKINQCVGGMLAVNTKVYTSGVTGAFTAYAAGGGCKYAVEYEGKELGVLKNVTVTQDDNKTLCSYIPA